MKPYQEATIFFLRVTLLIPRGGLRLRHEIRGLFQIVVLFRKRLDDHDLIF